jgi:hypothetical protein
MQRFSNSDLILYSDMLCVATKRLRAQILSPLADLLVWDCVVECFLSI